MKAPSRVEILKRGIRGECPRCQARELFESHYRLRQSCPSCQLPLEAEDGWSYGAVPLNYSLTCIWWILPVGLLFLFGLITIKIALILAGAGALVIPLLTYRLSKRLWVGIYYAVLPQELSDIKD